MRAGLPGWRTRFEPMGVIARRLDCRVDDIASELVITVGGTSKLVDRIEAAGCCRRRANPGDRRSSIVELTPVGRRQLARATKFVDDELAIRLGSAVAERSLTQFGATLGKLRAARAFRGSEDTVVEALRKKLTKTSTKHRLDNRYASIV
jgi:DNA-binding MarR family transcriptional regulator